MKEFCLRVFTPATKSLPSFLELQITKVFLFKKMENVAITFRDTDPALSWAEICCVPARSWLYRTVQKVICSDGY